ncbi:VOC family protein [Stappia sp. ES.058]|uniref:VOC family protein n=1 Tax=Stappia sp. ES.058 TaxID=1881061 RepID=UPI001FCD534E|nr:VOC family protein [Stappia sp. ES.058]
MSTAIQSVPVLRVARPTNDLAPLERFYMQGAGFRRLAAFSDHVGFSGTIIGYPGAPWHLELVQEHGEIAPRAQSPEHLLVLYLPDPADWRVAVDRMTAHGYEPVPAHNPYWEVAGTTFEDPDGFRLVFQNRAWDL